MKPNELKHDSFQKALSAGIAVNELVTLVPVGPWLLSEPEIIEAMARWRQKNMHVFFAKFDSTADKTLDYLEKASIGQENRILFLIFENGQAIGHLGVSNISAVSGELDNVMRGEKSKTSGLMQLSIEALSAWVKTDLNLRELTLKVSTENERAIALYKKCGFEITKNSALKESQSGDVTQFVECDEGAATTSIRSLTMAKSL